MHSGLGSDGGILINPMSRGGRAGLEVLDHRVTSIKASHSMAFNVRRIIL